MKQKEKIAKLIEHFDGDVPHKLSGLDRDWIEDNLGIMGGEAQNDLLDLAYSINHD